MVDPNHTAARDTALQDPRALELALQRSELTRLSLLMLIFSLLATLALLRLATDPTRVASGSMPNVFVFGAAVAYTMVMRAYLGRAVKASVLLPQRLWTADTLVESLVPTLVFAIRFTSDQGSNHRASAWAALLIYGVIICLCVLRLRPGLCILSSLVGAFGYVTVLGLTGRFADPSTRMEMVSLHAGFVVPLVMTGIAAAFVCVEVRKHVALAVSSATAREKLTSLHRELDLARQIQVNLLPKPLPRVPGLQIAAVNRPAEHASGDYYDCRVLADGSLAVLVADVCGHGIAPAMLMATCSAYARAILATTSQPASVLEQLNRMLLPHVPDARFITLALAIIDPARRVARFASAGHGPTLHVARGAAVTTLDSTGLPLGIDGGAEFGPELIVPLEAGDMLVLLSDGFVETLSAAGECFGTPRLVALTAGQAGLSAEEFLAQLEHEVAAFAAGTEQIDDVTAMVVKMIPAPGR